MVKAVLVNPIDNVAMVTTLAETGDEIIVTETGKVVKALEPIKAGHKVALTRLEEGENVIKYGIPIGRMMSAVDVGEWISVHNLEDTTAELCGTYCQEFRDGIRTINDPTPQETVTRMIKAFPRKDGTFGIRNYVIVISTSPETNAVAEAISDKTGCAWFVCDRTRLEEDGSITEYTRDSMIYTGRAQNIYATLVLGFDGDTSESRGICESISEKQQPTQYLSLTGIDEAAAISEGTAIIEAFQKDASEQKRELVSMEGFGLTVHCSGSDWTTAINGNASVGKVADKVVEHGGKVFMTEWMEWSGSQHVMAARCATRELGLELLDFQDSVRDVVLKETGLPVEHMNPAPGNKEGGLTTLAEKAVGTIKKSGTATIQGLLDHCQQPTGKGVWLPKSNTVWSPSTALYGSFGGAHLSILITGLGGLYYELPHMVTVRVTGNPVTFANEDFKLDFNAGIALEKPLSEVADILFEYIIRVAEGEDNPNTEHENKIRALNMYYYNEREFERDTDRSRFLPLQVREYAERTKELTDLVK